MPIDDTDTLVKFSVIWISFSGSILFYFFKHSEGFYLKTLSVTPFFEAQYFSDLYSLLTNLLWV